MVVLRCKAAPGGTRPAIIQRRVAPGSTYGFGLGSTVSRVPPDEVKSGFTILARRVP